MSVKKINDYFKTAVKTDIINVTDKLALNDRQSKLFTLKYLDKLDISTIVSETGLKKSTIERELAIIRKMLMKLEMFGNIKDFKCNTATEDEMRIKCRRMGKSKEYTDFCVDAFVHRLRRKELADKYQISDLTAKKYKHDRHRELENS